MPIAELGSFLAREQAAASPVLLPGSKAVPLAPMTNGTATN
jgi:hypothetical protein